jgi:tetratricopeptide (TPR) repeat protein|nr:tetratricopeptide repeat protein [Kofleriaceae bacterium]
MWRALMVIVLVLAGVAAPPARADPGDWAPQRDPFDPAVVARYRAILASAPYDASALGKLEQLYRSYRTLAALDAVYASDRSHAGLVVRARLARDHDTAHDPATTPRTLFAAVVTDDASDTRGWLALAELDRAAADRDGAKRDYARVIALADAAPRTTPRDALEAALAATAELARDDRDVAALEVADDRVAALAPRDGAWWLARGDAELATGSDGARHAADSYRAAESRFGDRDPERRLEALADLGSALEAAHDDDGAVAAYRRVVALAPRGYFLARDVIGRVVEVYRRRHALPDLAGELERTWPTASRGFVEWQTLGTIYADTGDAPRAIDALGAAARAAPGETATARLLVALLDRADRPADALAALAAAARAAPGDTGLAIEVADRTYRSDPAAGLALLHRAEAAATRTDASAYAALGDAYLRHDRRADAARLLERASRADPQDEQIWLALANLHLATGDAEAAVAAWSRVATRSAESLRHLGRALYDAQAYRLAARAYGDAIAIAPTDPSLLHDRAWAHDGTGDSEAAVADALAAVALTPPDHEARMHARYFAIEMINRGTRRGGEYRVADYLASWRDRFAASPPDVDSGYLLADAYLLLECSLVTSDDPAGAVYSADPDVPCKAHGPVDFLRVVEQLAALEPDDWYPQDVYARSLLAGDRFSDAVAAYDRIALDFPDQAVRARHRIAEIRDQHPELAPIGDPFPDASTVGRADDGYGRSRVGVGLGAALRRNRGVAPVVSAHARYAIAGGIAFAGRVDWTAGGDADGDAGSMATPGSLGASAGFAGRVATTDLFALGLETAADVEWRDSAGAGATMTAGAGAGFEVGADLALTALPASLVVRVERWGLAGPSETRVVVGLSFDLF